MKYIFTSILLSWCTVVSAQYLTASKNTHQFQQSNENESDSVQLFIRNNYNSSVDIVGISIPEVYNDPPFTSKLNGTSIAANDSVQLKLYFTPEQNILFEQDAVVSFSNGESIAIELSGQGKFSNSYYDFTENKIEENLKNALNYVTGYGYNHLGYTTARDNMYATIDNHNGQVECVYTGRKATFNTRSGANANSFNCEHTFPQSKYNSKEPEKSDIHHLFPSDASTNSRRSNLPFGVVTGSPSWSEGGSKKGGGVFEPRDEHKGDCARAMMYFVIRYSDHDNFFAPQENLLRQWHLLFPPSQQSIERNNDIDAVQNNRNPFVDYPQFVHRISNLSGNSSAPVENEVTVDARDVTIGSAVASSQSHHVVTKAVSNTGNQPVTLKNFSFSSGSHTVLNLPQSGTIELDPNESVTLEIGLDFISNGNINTTLNFETSSPSNATVAINISGTVTGLHPMQVNNMLKAFPNPASGSLVITGKDLLWPRLQLINALGEAVNFTVSVLSNDRAEISCPDCRGVFFLCVEGDTHQKPVRVVFK